MEGRGASPLMVGLAGPELTAREEALFARLRPLAFILFARNIVSPEQARALIERLKPLCGGPYPLIAIDQEGGRVQRLKFAGGLPSVRAFGAWYVQNPEKALEAAQLYGAVLGAEMRSVGANWLLAPVLDVAVPETHTILASRCFSDNPEHVALLADAYMQGIASEGGVGCLKHAPGHGRSAQDSHVELPRVAADAAALELDSLPFRQLAPQAFSMMTAHIHYPALDDSGVPATYSPRILNGLIRKDWGFKRLILADDVGMAALEGPYVQRIRQAVEAGCDVAITALSMLKHGMAGTVWHEEHFAELEAHADSLLALPEVRAERLADLPPVPTHAPDAAKLRAALHAMWVSSPVAAEYAWPD